MDAFAGVTDRAEKAQKALAIARGIDDPALLTRALTACGSIAAYNADVARPLLAEAVDLARAMGDKWRLAENLAWQSYAAINGEGDPVATRAAGEEARDLADEMGDAFLSRSCRWFLALAHLFQGDLESAIAMSRGVMSESDAAHDTLSGCCAQVVLAHALAQRGDTDAARAAAQASVDVAVELSPVLAGSAYAALAIANLAAGDIAAAEQTSDSAARFFGSSKLAVIQDPNNAARIAHARGDLEAARRMADAAVSATRGAHRALALTQRCHVGFAQGDSEQAERDANDALKLAASVGAYLWIPDILECLASLAAGEGRSKDAIRLFGAADAARVRMKVVPRVGRAFVDSSLTMLQEGLGDSEFDAAWAEGAALPTDEAIAYAQRGRGERKRPASGWKSLTPTELDVTRLVSEGLANKDIAARLFVSPRTVQTHLTHVYTKLGLTSRVQLAQEAARHA